MLSRRSFALGLLSVGVAAPRLLADTSSDLALEATKTHVSPNCTTTAPWACFANSPVSNFRILPPISRSTVTFMSVLFPLQRTVASEITHHE